jgi:hypothetical protein
MVRWVVLHAVPYIRKTLCLENTQGSPQSEIPGCNSETRGKFCNGLHRNIVVQYSLCPIITLHSPITAREYMDRFGNQVHPMTQTLVPNNNVVFQHDNAPIHTAGTVQSWIEEHEGKLQHLPRPAQSPYLNIIEPLWSVLETRVRNRFPPPNISKATWRCYSRRMV